VTSRSSIKWLVLDWLERYTEIVLLVSVNEAVYQFKVKKF
jgi:hypothetical protein